MAYEEDGVVELEFGDDELELMVDADGDGVACRVCGCTEHHACATPHGSCFWIEADLCSACARSS